MNEIYFMGILYGLLELSKIFSYAFTLWCMIRWRYPKFAHPIEAAVYNFFTSPVYEYESTFDPVKQAALECTGTPRPIPSCPHKGPCGGDDECNYWTGTECTYWEGKGQSNAISQG